MGSLLFDFGACGLRAMGNCVATPTRLDFAGCTVTYYGAPGSKGMPGQAEKIRLAMVLGGIPFEQVGIPPPKWREQELVGPKTSWGIVPMVTLKTGATLQGSHATLLAVGKSTGLYPMFDFLQAQRVDECIQAMDTMVELVNPIGAGEEQTVKEAKRKEACESGAIFKLLQQTERFIAANGANGFAVGGSLTIADLAVYCNTSNLIGGLFDGVPSTALDPFPTIQAVRKNVANVPAIAAFYDAIPEEELNKSFRAVYKQARDLLDV